MIWYFILILILVGLNGFFVAVEFAAVASRRARLNIIADPGNSSARLVKKWLENPTARDRLIAATQIGITAVSLTLGAIGEKAFQVLLEPYFHRLNLPANLVFINQIVLVLPLLISLIIVTSLHIVLGEQVPKIAVIRNPERFAIFSAPFMHGFEVVFKGFINLLDWATHATLKLLGIPLANPHTLALSEEEFKQILSGPEMEGVIEPSEREIINAVIDFGDLVVRQVMTPRTEMVAVEAITPLSELINLAIQNPVSKFPVYEESIDQIVGIAHVQDILAAMQKPEKDTVTARMLAREVVFVPEAMAVNDLLQELRQRRQHMAIALDEYGGTSGLVTLNDLMEELVGEFLDAFDPSQPTIQSMPDGSAVIDGLMLIEEVNEHLGLNLTDPHYDTIAGYVLGKVGRIPKTGEVIADHENNIQFKIKAMDRLRIAQVVLTRLAEE